LQTDQEYMASSVSNCKPRCLQRCTGMFCDSTRQCCPELWATGKRFPLHANVQPHTSLPVREFLSVHQITELPHVPYSPDLSPCDYCLFPWLNKHWKATVTMMSGHSDSRDKTTLQHCSKCFAGLLQRPQEMLEAVHWCRRKLFERRLLAPECKYTAFILIPSVSELSGHTIHTNTLLSTDINIHSNVAYTNKASIEYPRIKINNSKCKVSNI
jgi:hypothetical protein